MNASGPPHDDDPAADEEVVSTTTTKKSWESRAVLRNVEAGSSAICAHCDEQVKFAAKERRQQVICNVYVDGKWDRVEHFHAECYEAAGGPYGEPQD